MSVQLEALTFTEKANRRYKNATPTKLYTTQEVQYAICLPVGNEILECINCFVMQLEEVAVAKWGSMAEVEQERNNREQKRLKRALESAGLCQQQLWPCNMLHHVCAP